VSTSVSKRDYYEVLGVDRDAGESEVKKAFRQLAIQHHPDKNPDNPESERLFKEAAEAYEVLSDSEKRARYDRYGHAGVEGAVHAGSGSFEGIFESFADLFGGGSVFEGFFGGGRGRRGPRQGASLRMDLVLDFLDAAKGVNKSVTFDRLEPCVDCRGSGAEEGTEPAACDMCNGRGQVVQSAGFFQVQSTCPRCRGAGKVIKDPCQGCRGEGRVPRQREVEVRIPAGVDEGVVLRVPGEGEPGEPGAPDGDLHCVIRVRPHEFFERQDTHVLLEVPITFTQAALGATIEVPTIDGKEKLKVKKGTQSGDLFTLRGVGIQNPRNKRRGDQVVRVAVDVPRKLTKRQEELLRELAQLEEAHVTPERKSWYDKLKSYFASDEA
jgi:molecular chaperone DnaJ